MRASLPNLAAKEPGQRSLNVFGYYPTQKYLGTGERLLVGNCDAASYANEGECSTLARAALHFFALLVSLLSLSLAALALSVASYRSPVLFDPIHPPLSLSPSLSTPLLTLSAKSTAVGQTETASRAGTRATLLQARTPSRSFRSSQRFRARGKRAPRTCDRQQLQQAVRRTDAAARAQYRRQRQIAASSTPVTATSCTPTAARPISWKHPDQVF